MNVHVNPTKPKFFDPAAMPKGKYAFRVAGDCLAPAIPDGAAVVVNPKAKIVAGELAVFFLKPQFVGPNSHTNAFLKRVVLNMMPGVTFPYQPQPNSNVMPVFIVEQDNPRRTYSIPADAILGVHRCAGLAGKEYRLVDDVAIAAGFDPEVEGAMSPKSPSVDSVTRRGVLGPLALSLPAMALAAPAVAAGAVTSSVGVPEMKSIEAPSTGAATKPDPIFAAIRDCVEAAAAREEAYEKIRDLLHIPEELEDAAIDAYNVEAEAMWALVRTRPTTLAGAVALLRYVTAHACSGATYPDGNEEGDATLEGHIGPIEEQCYSVQLHAAVADALEKMMPPPALAIAA